MRRSALCQTLRDKSEFKGEITQGRFRLPSGSWSHCYTQKLKITQRGKWPVRRCAYLSSISFRVLLRHPHKHRSDLARLSENIRLKQQQTGFILESHPRTDACSTLPTISNRNADALKHRRVMKLPFMPPPPQPKWIKKIIEDRSSWMTSPSSFRPKGSQSSQ